MTPVLPDSDRQSRVWCRLFRSSEAVTSLSLNRTLPPILKNGMILRRIQRSTVRSLTSQNAATLDLVDSTSTGDDPPRSTRFDPDGVPHAAAAESSVGLSTITVS